MNQRTSRALVMVTGAVILMFAASWKPPTAGAVQPEPAPGRDVLPSDAAFRASEGRLRKQLFVVVSTSQGPLSTLKPVLPAHLEYLAELERSGELFMAGPLMNEDHTTWSGDGMLVYNAASHERAAEIAAKDPLHVSGVRAYTIRPWLLNDGSLSINVSLSTQRVTIP